MAARIPVHGFMFVFLFDYKGISLIKMKASLQFRLESKQKALPENLWVDFCRLSVNHFGGKKGDIQLFALRLLTWFGFLGKK
jgi:hypothetical protein